MGQGIIFDIQRFALHDGPGIRTTVFFQGCSCRCTWCHNPESQLRRPQLEYYPSRCIGCGECVAICANNILKLEENGLAIERKLCRSCGSCVKRCYAGALVLKGSRMHLEEVMEPILADKVYYEESGGGITLSGGDPVLQSGFALELLQACKKEGFHTVLQTAGNYPFNRLEPLLPYLDMVMYDFKAWREESYQEHIHGDRELIVANLHNLDAAFSGQIAVRTPCIQPVNATLEEITALAEETSKLRHLTYYQLIPYHPLAQSKYEALGRPFEKSFTAPSPELLEELESAARRLVPVFTYKDGVE